MKVAFNLTQRARTSDHVKRSARTQERKTYVYPNRKSDLNFDEMYQELNPNVAQLVEENRLQLNSMNCVKSKMLVNSTQMKLVAFMRYSFFQRLRSKPLSKKQTTFLSQQKIQRSYYQSRDEDHKQNSSRQIFDYSKLQQIVKSYDRNTGASRVQGRGVLTQKVLKLTGKGFYIRPQTMRLDEENKLERTERDKNYQGWKSEKSKRRMKHMFA